MRKAVITPKGFLYVDGAGLEVHISRQLGEWLALADKELATRDWERTGDWVHDHPTVECRGWTAWVERKKMVVPVEPAIRDSDTFTFAELRKVMGSSWTGGPISLIHAIKMQREPDYPVGTVVRDTNGTYWKRIDQKRWKSFDHILFFADGVPARPLQVMP